MTSWTSFGQAPPSRAPLFSRSYASSKQCFQPFISNHARPPLKAQTRVSWSTEPPAERAPGVADALEHDGVMQLAIESERAAAAQALAELRARQASRRDRVATEAANAVTSPAPPHRPPA
ncbi:hypothetical protein KFE25_010122 [Diacronema lutheri]|uniref:Uncharacterized protein n=1 Tax=Diacronema lutheri TaxID=2081491 RepID=A0A8J6C9N7_DIALT|nr:hypothetical protein KFE25_010122 [Diacronema lutheri]